MPLTVGGGVRSVEDARALLLAGANWALPGLEERRYAQTLAAEIARVEPGSLKAATLDQQIDNVQKRTQLLDDLRRRPKADMDALQEMTRILAPPTWLNLMEVSAKQVVVGGETDQAAPLLKTIDTSALFEGSEFVGSPVRMQQAEMFRIRTNREALQPPAAISGGKR